MLKNNLINSTLLEQINSNKFMCETKDNFYQFFSFYIPILFLDHLYSRHYHVIDNLATSKLCSFIISYKIQQFIVCMNNINDCADKQLGN